MTARVCYLSRTDRGARIAAARLVGGPLDARWEGAHGENGTADPLGEARAAAAWVGDRLTQGDGERGRLRFVCLDPDGSICSWLTAPSADSSVVAAAMTQDSAADGQGEAGAGGGAPWADMTPGEATLQALASPPERRAKPSAAGHRLAAVAVPDVAARLFLDALDERGVSADGVVSIWHGLAAAWDPGGPASQGSTGGASLREDRVVATATPPSAIIAFDPAGRLIWAWSRAGELLACGAFFLSGQATADGHARVSTDDVGRLTTDWLAWAAQLGVAPSRIVCIGPGEGESGLSASQIGEAIGRAWPGATIDFAVHDDPIGATLHRLSEVPVDASRTSEDPRAGLVPLARRPSRAHRAMLQAVGATLLLGAAGFAGFAWRAFSAAGEIRADAAAKAEDRRTLIASALPQAANDPWPDKLLNEELARLRAAQDAGKELDPAKPILQELEVISMVLTEEMRPESISLHNSIASMTVVVPNLQTGSDLLDGLSAIDGSSVDWNTDQSQPTSDGKLRFHFNGIWRSPAARSSP